MLKNNHNKQQNKNMKNTNTNKQTQRRNKQWLRSRDQRKHMKRFTVEMVQNKDGSFHMLGGGSRVEIRTNARGSKIVPVDVRDLACEIRMNGIRSF